MTVSEPIQLGRAECGGYSTVNLFAAGILRLDSPVGVCTRTTRSPLPALDAIASVKMTSAALAAYQVAAESARSPSTAR